jgi:hypothetical protein
MDPVGRGAMPVKLHQERIHTPVNASHTLPQILPPHPCAPPTVCPAATTPSTQQKRG